VQNSTEMFGYVCTGKSAHQVVFEITEAARSRVIGFVSIVVMSCVLVFVVVLDLRTLRKSARPRCRCLATRAPVSQWRRSIGW